jgi:hypothetical protein
MGFFRDFENELKIFFVLIALLILAGWLGALSSLSFFNFSIEREQKTANTAVVTEVAEEQEQQQEEEQEQENLVYTKEYINESLGISFTYPKDWFVYDEAAWQQDDAIAPCEVVGTIENTLIVSSKNLGRCVGVQAFNAWPGDLLLSFSKKEWRNFPFVLEGEDPGLAEVGGISAAKYPFLEGSASSRKQATRFYINAAQRGYIIEITQTDTAGNYNPALEEILASFEWL